MVLQHNSEKQDLHLNTVIAELLLAPPPPHPRELGKERLSVDFQAVGATQGRASIYRFPFCRNKELFHNRNTLGT